jgi:anti-sigma factor RsiW
MNHLLTMKRNAAERYLLGELSPADRASFESHFFECESCADEVRLCFQLRENAETVFAEEPQPARLSPRPVEKWRWHWIRPALLTPAAACLITLIAGYQNLVQLPSLRAHIAGLEQPQVLQASIVLPPLSRSAAPTISVSPAAPFFPLSLGLGAIQPATGYECDIRSESGQTIWKIRAPRLDADSNLNLFIPTSKTPPGRYVAVLRAIAGSEVLELERYAFAIRRE